ncbi:TIGR00645 family protein [Cellulomonas sp. HZM]|uniref:TIGR00645 family protein n=1 Tax=Cellulomonas sp. HZM TaxID=1454010 RepID=UPI000493980F|nr:TIGR00645 family protein [Cellulomonas sp. HZM]
MPHTQPTTTPTPQAPATRGSTLGSLIFLSRWLQVPLYLGLIVAQAVYVWQFMKELWHLAHGVFSGHGLSEGEIIIAVLGLVDVVMIANLLIMVIVGGYETFVSRIRLDNHPDQPEWLSHVNANVLKTKLAMSIIGISSIHLLRSFIEAGATVQRPHGGEALLWQTVIHLTFIVSAVALAWIDKMSVKHPPRPRPGVARVDAADDGPPAEPVAPREPVGATLA